VRTANDVLRSLSRYVALAVGPEWEVRYAVEEGAFERPFVRVTPSTPTSWTARGMHYTVGRRTFTVICFPLVMASEEEARIEADRVEELLFQGFSRGVHTPSFSNHSGRAHPLRVPLYDFSGIAADRTIEDAVAADGLPRRAANDFVRVVETPSFGAIPDLNEDRAYMVTGDLRLEWDRSVAYGPPGPIAEPPGIVPTPVPPGP